MERRKFHTLFVVLEVALSGVMVWYMLPLHQRKQALMRLSQQGQTGIQWAARMTSQYAMRCELAGDVLPAAAGYDIARRLMSGPFEFARQRYDNLRG